MKRKHRVVLWGTFDTKNTRNRVTLDLLPEAAEIVAIIHHPIWLPDADKTQIGVVSLLLKFIGIIPAYIAMLYRYWNAPEHDAVIVLHPGILDVCIVAPLAKLRRKAIIWDMFVSAYTTFVTDRRLVAAGHPLARVLKGYERFVAGCADRVILDTKTSAGNVFKLLRLRRQPDVVPISADPVYFPYRALVASDLPFTVLFYAKFAPLHGLSVVLEAVKLLAGEGVCWRFIGMGQEGDQLSAFMAEHPELPVTWIRHVPYEELLPEIAGAHICLGLLGDINKAQHVVAHKMYQALHVGRPIITLDSVALRDLIPEEVPGLYRLKQPTGFAVAEAIRACRAEYGELRRIEPLFASVRGGIDGSKVVSAWLRVFSKDSL